jgi:hypothetical protein
MRFMIWEGGNIVDDEPPILGEMFVHDMLLLGRCTSLCFFPSRWLCLLHLHFSGWLLDSYSHTVFVEKEVAHECLKTTVFLLHFLMVAAALICSPAAKVLAHQLEDFIQSP